MPRLRPTVSSLSLIHKMCIRDRVFVHLLVDLALDVLFNVQYLRLPAQDLQQLFQAAGHSALIEQRLLDVYKRQSVR